MGFGISTPQQVTEVARMTDGVVIGSAIVKFIEENAASGDLPAKLEDWTRQLSSGLRPQSL
jgi:tryptophan synthase alpha chain